MLTWLAAGLLVGPSLTIRTAEVDISPPEPLPLGGYTERKGKLMDEGGEPLYARTLIFGSGLQTWAVVSAEMLTIPESLYREVKSRIPDGVHLFLQATHTHAAPDSQMLNERMTFAIPGIASFRKRWLTWYSDKIASSVNNALAATPSPISFVSADLATVAANRPRREGGKPDKTFVKVKADGATIFAYFTAHPTVLDDKRNQTHGDWIGLLAKQMGVPVMNGAIGDVSPVADEKDPTTKFSNFLKAFDKPRWTSLKLYSSGEPVGWSSSTINLLPRMPHPTFAKQNGIPEPLAKNLVERFAPSEADVAAFRLGDLAVVGIPGEPTSILGREIASAGKKLGFKVVLVGSHVNGWMGYILDPRDYSRGGYEATLSFYGKDEGRNVVRSAVQALKALRESRPHSSRRMLNSAR